MKSALKLVSIKGTSVYLHFTFLFFLVWMLVVYAASGMKGVQLLWSFLFLIAVFICITLHEYGHALVASDFGLNAKKITLYPIGGIASLDQLPDKPRQELLISIAGPVVSFILAAFLLLFAPQTFSVNAIGEYTGVITASNFIYSLGVINFILAVFNLIPAFPMDGGRILRALLAFKYNYVKATSIAANVGRIIALVFVVGGLVTMHLLLSALGLFIILFADAEESYLRLKALLKGVRVKEVLMKDYESIEAGLTIKEAINILHNKHDQYFIVMQQGQAIGSLNRAAVIKAVAAQDYEHTVNELMEETPVRINADVMVEKFLEQLSRHEEKIFPVFENGNFIGVISFQNIIEYLLLNKEGAEKYRQVSSIPKIA